MTGITGGVDIFIGPLFTDAVIEARAVMDDFDKWTFFTSNAVIVK